MSTCKFCQSAIWWVLSPRGKWVPLDPEPVAGGRFVKTGRATASQLVGIALERAQIRGRDMFRHHQESCSGASVRSA